MPIEIRELIIRTEVTPTKKESGEAESPDIEVIVQESVRRIMEALGKQEER